MKSNRILRTGLMLTIGLALAVSMWGIVPAQMAMAAGTIQYYPTQGLPRNASFSGSTLMSGTPFAVYAQITGAPANVSCNGPKIRLMPTSTGGTADTTFRTWAGSISGWLRDSGDSWSSFPIITTDGAGNWSGWGYGAIPSTATNTWLAVRINCGGNNYETTRVAVTLMDMSATGGWIEETETSGGARAGRAIVVKNGAAIVGMYVAEDNNVIEGYSLPAGGFRVAVPDCSTCGYTIETRNLATPNEPVGRINTMGVGGCPSSIVAGGTTSLDSCNTPTIITLSSLRATSGRSGLPRLAILMLSVLVANWAWRRWRESIALARQGC